MRRAFAVLAGQAERRYAPSIWIHQQVVPYGARFMVYADESRIYYGPKNRHTVNHGAGEYVRGDVHTNGMESFWALLRRGYHGTYHKMSPKHLHLFVNEFASRLNERFRDTADMLTVLARHMVERDPHTPSSWPREVRAGPKCSRCDSPAR